MMSAYEPAQKLQTPLCLTRRQLLVTAACAGAVRRVYSQSAGPKTTSAAAIKSRPIFYDQDGLIVHVHETKDGKRQIDGGDTAQREGWYWAGRWVREKVLND